METQEVGVVVDRPAAWSHYGMGEVLDVFEERDRSGEPPFGDVLEAIHVMEESNLAHIDIGNAIARLVCEGRLRFALDGIRLTQR